MMMPDWANYVRVDELIECYPIKDSTQGELMRAMPDAYGGEPPGEDNWPEPDAARDAPYKLSKVWKLLDDTTKADLIAAYDAEHG